MTNEQLTFITEGFKDLDEAFERLEKDLERISSGVAYLRRAAERMLEDVDKLGGDDE